MPCFLKILAASADVAVHAGQQLVEEFDHGHLGAQTAPHRTEFQADHAAADHDQVLGTRSSAGAGRVHDHPASLSTSRPAAG
jgi:hypothetical protein